MIFLFMLAPIIATAGNIIITSQMQMPQAYFTEIYLIIFWIFAVSGLRFLHATLSAIGIIIVSFMGIYFFFPSSKELYFLHFFWIFVSFSLGFYTGYMLEQSKKNTFLAYEALIVMTSTDSLSGFQNKNNLADLIRIEVSRFKRYGHPFSIVLMSIDSFKELKAIYGHQISDLVLIELAQLIKEHIRLTDIVVKWEAEEFVIIYQETDEEVLKTLAEKLCHSIEEYTFKNVGQKTISAGLTSYREHDDPDAIIKRADMALSKARMKGKNRIEFL
jgi:diguanylate cyclase (GGDEF)-like protein